MVFLRRFSAAGTNGLLDFSQQCPGEDYETSGCNSMCDPAPCGTRVRVMIRRVFSLAPQPVPAKCLESAMRDVNFM